MATLTNIVAVPEARESALARLATGLFFALIGAAAVVVSAVALGRVGGRPTFADLPAAMHAASGGGAGAVTLAVEASEFKFSPAPLTMAAPGELTVVLANRGAIEHDLSIEGVAGKAYARGGGTGQGTFVIIAPGTYTAFCSVIGHKEAGMRTTLVVG